MGWMDSLNEAARAGKKKLTEEQSEAITDDLIVMSSFGAATVTLLPIPLSDFMVVTPIQASMVTAIGRVWGRELTLEESKHVVLELAGVCGLSLVAQKGFATLTKILLPGLGGVLAAPWAFAVTYGMGRVATQYFRHRELTRTAMKTIFDQAVAEGKSAFSKDKFNEFRKKHGKGVEDFINTQKDGGGDEEEEAPAPKKKKKPAAKKKKPAVKKKASAPPEPDGGDEAAEA